MYKIGNLTLKNPLILAPMAGITSLPYRTLNRMFGCELAFVEMIDVSSLCYSRRKTLQMLRSNAKDRPLGIQLVGIEPKFILKALTMLESYEYDILDFNAACPKKKVTGKGKGAMLLKTPKKLKEILALLVKNCAKPVTVKLRLGWDFVDKAEDIVRYAEDAGVSAVFVHGRTRNQGYSGAVNYEVIRKIKKASQIPVIASGDVFNGQLVKKMFDETGCDAVTVARGALGNPWIFKSALEFLRTGITLPKPRMEELSETMRTHFALCVDFYGEKKGVIDFRKFFIWYTKGLPGAKSFRGRATSIKTIKEMNAFIGELCNPLRYAGIRE